MFTVLLLMLLGMVLGYLIRNRQKAVKLIDRLINWAIYLLLLLLGISVGANQTIMKNLATLGVTALALTLGAVAGSVGLAYFTYKLFFAEKK
jgi:uncharacterized membrane protein YbjE (DUF340 family)